MNQGGKMEEIDLRELLELFWNKKSQVILLVLIFMVLGVIYTIGFTTPMYSSSTTLVLASTGTSQTTASTDSITATDITMNSKLVSTYSELVKSKNVLRQVISNLGIDVEEEELRKNITVSAVKDTELIEITVMNKNPSYSSKIANEIAKVFTEKVREIYKIDNVQVVDNAETATNPSNINHKRDIAISTVGIITSFQTICQMPLTGLMQGQQPLISYNYGANKPNRVIETLKYSIIGGTIIALIGFLAVQLLPDTIIRMFNDEVEVITLGTKAIRIWFICLPVLGIQIMAANYFQCIGKIKVASILNLLRQIIILIPVMLLLSSLIGLDGIFIAVPIADFSAFVITVILFIQSLKKNFMHKKNQ